MLDVQTRRLRYAIAVAEHRSFTHAAAALHVTQQAIGEQVHRLESDLGFRLFERTTRSVAPTAAGAHYLRAARRALGLLDEAALRGAELARPRRVLRVGFLTGAALELTDPILDAFAAAQPDVVVELVEQPLHDPSAGLRNRLTDVAFVRMPFTAEDLDVRLLATEPRVAAVADGHPLATQTAIEAPQIADEPLVGAPGEDPVFSDFWALADVLGDHAPPTTRTAASVAEEMQLVARGTAVSITALSASRLMPWPGVTFIPLADCPPSRISVAARAGDDRPAVRAFLQTAETAAADQQELVRAIADARAHEPLRARR